MTADELERLYAQHWSVLSRADDGELTEATMATLDALPILSISHCWESPEHPDPYGRTLAQVAAKLAGTWSGAEPQSGLPLFRAWGFDDMGVFFDWGSLYQKPRT